jgi:hypothetical protein
VWEGRRKEGRRRGGKEEELEVKIRTEKINNYPIKCYG